jgi:hypothetical protein
MADPPLDHRFGWLRGSYRICVAVPYLLPPGCGPLDSSSLSLARGFRRGLPSDDFEGQPAGCAISADNHPVAGIQGSREDHAGQLVVHPPLYRTPQGPRAPNSGSKPSSAISPTAPSVNSASIPWALRRLVGVSWGAVPSFSSMASQRSEGGRGGSPAPSSPSRRTCRSGLWSQGPNALRASARRHEKGRRRLPVSRHP